MICISSGGSRTKAGSPMPHSIQSGIVLMYSIPATFSRANERLFKEDHPCKYLLADLLIDRRGKPVAACA
ncbi:hypothetical protein HZ326_30144 [Fusarium oxysporum f. sp. albedinis]|nr:hypothetical protein HZ326_30144 [Fusarium oxysporum f. sp. albedinis]